MITVDWDKLRNCDNCGNASLDIESEDRISKNYYIYCLDCRYQAETAIGKNSETNQEVADRAFKNWNKT